MDSHSRIYVAGHRGLVGSALLRRLEAGGYDNVRVPDERLDLTDKAATRAWFDDQRPEYVIVAAAKVGGIRANDEERADFIHNNLQIAAHVIDEAHRHDVKKLLFLGSSCIYPKHAPQPIKEEHLFTGPLEDTNEAYAIAKIAGMIMCRSYNIQYGTNFIAAMPTNLYGPGDNFDLRTAHVLPALIRRFHEAKIEGKPAVELWGTGNPRREFLHVDDLADALVFLMNRYDARRDDYFMNVGVGKDSTISELAKLVASVVGYDGEIVWNTDMPDGTPRKLLDVSRIERLGWKAKTALEEGVRRTYRWFVDHYRSQRDSKRSKARST